MGTAARWRGVAATGGVVSAFAVVMVLAIRADLATLGLSVSATVMDIGVGVAFGAAAVLSPVRLRQRLLVASVGAAWLLASLLPVRSLHQALLAAALVCFPTGRPVGRLGWLVLASAVPLALGWFAQPAAAVALLLAGLAGSRADGTRMGTLFPLAAGGAVAAVLATSWGVSRWVPMVFDPRLALLAYEGVLVAVAVGHVLAAGAAAAASAGRVEQALARAVALTETGRLLALEPLLREALRDPNLSIRVWNPDDAAVVDEPGDDHGIRLVVDDPVGLPVVVETDSSLLMDPAIADAVRSVVRLVIVQQRLQVEQEHELAELQATRRRLLEVADRQRESVAARLGQDVLPALNAAAALLPGPGSGSGRDPVGDPLRVVREELAEASAEVMGLVAGVPPETLGDGRLAGALQTLVARSPIPVKATVAPGAAADSATETTLYYVCLEGLANVAKHSGARSATVCVQACDGCLVLTVSDDGHGGADPGGSGIRGLADRVEAHGGTLRLHSDPGEGTTLIATLPLS